ncbi:MAG: class I tRNA ligase family protein, partial [Phycisphaerae bacterium]
VADYVLMSYGTGAIMAVPAHDTRDFEFAKEFGLPIRAVVMPPDDWLREQISSGAIDRTYADKRGLGREAESLMQSACAAATTISGVTIEDPRALIDGDSSWIRQLGRPSYLADPGLFAEAYVGDGTAVHSGEFDGLPTAAFKKKITAWLEARGLGRAAVNYKLRDWLFSRQRYWGEPFPILHGPDGEIVALDESELPLELPEIDDYRPTTSTDEGEALPEPPLGRAKDWATVQRNGKTYRRELNTMPQWAGSCWYYLRFCDPKNEARLCGKAAEAYWMVSRKKDGTPHAGGIDLYLGGAEHAVLHLLYARFWHKVLYDLGEVSTPEPFGRLFNQGMIRAFAYKDDRDVYVGYDEIDFREDGAYRKADGCRLSGAVEKMSKSLKNVINPDEVVREYGADSLRLYEMFMGPLDASKPWNPRDVPGVFRFLQRVWRLITGGGSVSVVDGGPADPALERALHQAIQKVTDDIERLAFNTAIAAMMAFVNEAYRVKTIHKTQAERFVLILSPFAPHLCEELWQHLRGAAWTGSLAEEPWPTHDPALLEDETVEVPIQVNGKLVGRVTVARDATPEEVQSAALAVEKVAARVGGGTVKKAIYVPGRMLNLIIRS